MILRFLIRMIEILDFPNEDEVVHVFVVRRRSFREKISQIVQGTRIKEIEAILFDISIQLNSLSLIWIQVKPLSLSLSLSLSRIWI